MYVSWFEKYNESQIDFFTKTSSKYNNSNRRICKHVFCFHGNNFFIYFIISTRGVTTRVNVESAWADHKKLYVYPSGHETRNTFSLLLLIISYSNKQSSSLIQHRWFLKTMLVAQKKLKKYYWNTYTFMLHTQDDKSCRIQGE